MADTKISALTAGAPAQTTDLIPIARAGANYSLLVSDLWTSPALTGNPTIAAGTATTAVSPLAITQTWNNGATTFPGIVVNITETLYAAGSNMIDFQSSGSSIMRLRLGSSSTPILTLGGPGSSVLRSTMELVNSTGGRLISIGGDITGIGVVSGDRIGFSSSATEVNAGLDGAFSRISAGLIGVGTGTAGSFAGRLKLTSAITAAVAVASLNASPTIGEVQTVNDALAVTVKGATVAAGGTAVCQVMWNGSNWVGI